MQGKRFGRPRAESVDDGVEPDEILARQIEQIFYDRLRLRVCDLVAAAHETRNVVPARNRLVHQQPALLACRTDNRYLFHKPFTSKRFLLFCCNLFDYDDSIAPSCCNVKRYNKLF